MCTGRPCPGKSHFFWTEHLALMARHSSHHCWRARPAVARTPMQGDIGASQTSGAALLQSNAVSVHAGGNLNNDPGDCIELLSSSVPVLFNFCKSLRAITRQLQHTLPNGVVPDGQIGRSFGLPATAVQMPGRSDCLTFTYESGRLEKQSALVTRICLVCSMGLCNSTNAELSLNFLLNRTSCK